MFSKLLPIVAALALLPATASAGIINFSGTLDASDPTFHRASSASQLSAFGTAVAYDTYQFIADAAGPYSISVDATAGGLGNAVGLDPFIYLYSSFNPSSPLANLVGADDDWLDPDGAGPITVGDGSLLASTQSFGSGVTHTVVGGFVTQSVLNLIGGTTYTLLISSFNNANVSTGLGSYTATITGGTSLAGASVPEPSTLALLAPLGLWLSRRQRRSAVQNHTVLG
ncbi:MAG: PEP-CTERM sorting domain-containing protein [Methylococcales bacterium]|nr:PEP-CTERM sorting domain-containing protein [Methylococcales bacterium]